MYVPTRNKSVAEQGFHHAETHVENFQKKIGRNDVQVPDIFNSKLLSDVFSPQASYSYYFVRVFDGRYDLLSEDIYGKSEYAWVIMLLNPEKEATGAGKIIRYINPEILDRLLGLSRSA